MKKAAATVPTTPKRLDLVFSSFGLSGFRVHRPNPMKLRDAAREITSRGTKAVMTWPIATMIAKFATVATKIPRSTLYGLCFAARDIAINWVLSPISATTMRANEAVKAATLKSNTVFQPGSTG